MKVSNVSDKTAKATRLMLAESCNSTNKMEALLALMPKCTCKDLKVIASALQKIAEEKKPKPWVSEVFKADCLG